MAPSNAHDGTASTAFPIRQLLVLGICRICEPIAFMSIFPYVYFMIESFHITSDANRIALFAGLVTSVFAAAECVGAGFWGNLSDRIGRKPVLLTGLAGTGVSMIIFGFAPNLAVALFARALGGALNGNIGVLQTTVNEVVKVKAHQARAFAVMPTVWCLGSFIGSGLGGALADPVRNYPSTFRSGTIFDKFPYLLTNLVCTGVVVFCLIVGFLFMEETHEDKKDRRDLGLEIGDSIIRCFYKDYRRDGLSNEKDQSLLADEMAESASEAFPLTDDDLPDYTSNAPSPALPAYRSLEATPRPSLMLLESKNDKIDVEEALSRAEQLVKAKRGVSRAFTKQVMLNILGFGILAFHTISAEQLLPVLLSLPKSDIPSHLPFQFMGGFALPTKTIGGILSVQGIIQMVITIVVFPWVNKRIGSLWSYRCAVLFYPFLYFVVPYVTLLPDALKLPAVYILLIWKVTSQAFAFPSSSIMLANAAPSSKVLGTLNGAAGAAASGARAIGPTLSGLVQSAGLSINTLGLPWWVNAMVAVAGAIVSLFMVVEEKRCDFAAEKSAPRRTSCTIDGDDTDKDVAQSSDDIRDRLLTTLTDASESTLSAEKSARTLHATE